jgi:hypothetical protein
MRIERCSRDKCLTRPFSSPADGVLANRPRQPNSSVFSCWEHPNARGVSAACYLFTQISPYTDLTAATEEADAALAARTGTTDAVECP